jgi:hypothetical protein
VEWDLDQETSALKLPKFLGGFLILCLQVVWNSLDDDSNILNRFWKNRHRQCHPILYQDLSNIQVSARTKGYRHDTDSFVCAL